MSPKQYTIGVYYGTKTLENLEKSSVAVLQLLSEENIGLIRLLGKKTGVKIDKHSLLAKKNALKSWSSDHVLDGACAYIKLHVNNRMNTQGDHELFVFDVTKFKTLREDHILMFQTLIDRKIIL